MAQLVKNPPVMRETWVQSLGWEDSPLERGKATHFSFLAWRIPWTEEPGGLQFMGSVSDMTERLSLTHIAFIHVPGMVLHRLNVLTHLIISTTPLQGSYYGILLSLCCVLSRI